MDLGDWGRRNWEERRERKLQDVIHERRKNINEKESEHHFPMLENPMKEGLLERPSSPLS